MSAVSASRLVEEKGDAAYMELAIQEAEAAARRGEVPVGAALVGADGVLLACDGNRSIELHDPTAHAEILALRQAGHLLGNYRLTGTTLYVTLESCPMCAAALVHARIGRVVYGAADPRYGGLVSQYRLGTDGRLNHRFELVGGVLADRCAALLKAFFRQRR